jgi:hypothetical protein
MGSIEHLSSLESFVKNDGNEPYQFYCPHCKKERRLAYDPNPGTMRKIGQIALTTAFLTVVLWPWFDIKGIVLVLPIWTVYELYFRVSARADLACPYCGFDPFLFLTDVQKAKKEIENYWRKKLAENGIPFPEETYQNPQLMRRLKEKKLLDNNAMRKIQQKIAEAKTKPKAP